MTAVKKKGWGRTAWLFPQNKFNKSWLVIMPLGEERTVRVGVEFNITAPACPDISKMK